jgi:hypothetical protein
MAGVRPGHKTPDSQPTRAAASSRAILTQHLRQATTSDHPANQTVTPYKSEAHTKENAVRRYTGTITDDTN